MATTKIQTGLRIDEASYDKLKIIAKREGRTLNNLIEQIIRLYIADYERSNGTVPQSQDL